MNDVHEHNNRSNAPLDGTNGEGPNGSRKKTTIGTRILRGVVTVVVILSTFVGWAAIRASKGTFWIFDRKPAPMKTDYKTYTDENRTFRVDFPLSLTVKQHIKNIPADGGKVVELQIHATSSERHNLGFSVSSYKCGRNERDDNRCNSSSCFYRGRLPAACR